MTAVFHSLVNTFKGKYDDPHRARCLSTRALRRGLWRQTRATPAASREERCCPNACCCSDPRTTCSCRRREARRRCGSRQCPRRRREARRRCSARRRTGCRRREACRAHGRQGRNEEIGSLDLQQHKGRRLLTGLCFSASICSLLVGRDSASRIPPLTPPRASPALRTASRRAPRPH